MNTNNYQRFNDEILFKRVARGPFGLNRQLVLSLASNNSFTLNQQMITEQEDGVKYIPVQGSIRIYRNNFMAFHDIITWALLHLNSNEIPSESVEYVEKLRVIAAQQMQRLEEEMIKIGFPPTNFHGQHYRLYNQQEESQQKKQHL